MNIHTLQGDPYFGSNLYLLYTQGENECVVVDPGGLQPETERFLTDNNLTPVAYLLTHPHIDHFSGLSDFIERWPAPVWLHPDGAALYKQAAQQAAMFGLDTPQLPEIDHWYSPPQQLKIGAIDLEIRHVPGHSPGCVAILFHEDGTQDDAPSVLVGDVLFSGSIGRTDLPGGSMSTILASIKTELLSLPDATIVYSGHGPSTTIGRERRSNLYLQGL